MAALRPNHDLMGLQVLSQSPASGPFGHGLS